MGIRWDRVRRWSASLGVGVMLAAMAGHADALTRPLEVYFIDVEGGAATLTVLPNGESVLVDSGWPGNGGRDARRIEHVARYVLGLRAIDHFVCTHWHTDHYGGTEDLARLMPILNYWDRGIPEQASDGARDFPTLIAAYKRASMNRSRPLRPGSRLALRDRTTTLTTVAANGMVVGEGKAALAESCPKHGAAPVKDESDNKLSISLLLRHGKFDFLNCGDLTWNIEHKLACPKNRVGQVDLWQVTHHGAPQSGNPALVEAIQPRCAVMVNGARKGGDPRNVQLLKNTPSVEGLFQLHRNVTSGPADNTDPAHIANLDEKCSGEFLKVRLSADGESYTVFKGSNTPLKTFRVR